MNFDKYEKNTVTTEENFEVDDDDGMMKTLRKLRWVMKTLDVPEAS